MEHDLSPDDQPFSVERPVESSHESSAQEARDLRAQEAAEPDAVLERVRYGLGKELRLYPDAFAVVDVEARDELRLSLASVRRLILAPGEQVPSKLVLMFDLDDGNTIIAAEGMSNVRDFRRLLARLAVIKPDLELDPPNMDEQLRQALDLRRRSLLGCYGSIILACFGLWVVYMVVALLPHLGAHATGH
jgi:hypothetical protein